MKTIKFITALFLFVFFAPDHVLFASPLNEKVKAGLQLMREEEKLAHDVYTVLFEKWQLRPFSNIAESEARHFEAVGFLLETYNLEDPAFEEPGKFTNKKLTLLYDSLVVRGGESLVAALEVGAYIEEIDIKDLQELLMAEPEAQIAAVYENLLWGSENHLRAFTRNLSVRGHNYIPKILSAESYVAITGVQQQAACGRNGRAQKGCRNRNRGGANCRYR